jgi:transposase-like protein
MGSVLHGSARTTPRIRAELQASKASTRSLAAEYGLNPKTVRKWRGRTTTVDEPMGPTAPKSTVLTPAEEVIVVAFRQKTLLPLDDVLGCLRQTIPMANALPGHLRGLDQRPINLQDRPAPAHSGTTHLVRA